MTTCDSLKLSRYVDGDLPPNERLSVNRHLRHCHRCTSELSDLREMDNVLRSWGARRAPAPETLDARIDRLVKLRGDRRPVKRVFALGRMMPAALGSSIAAVLVLLSVNLHGVSQSPSASETAWANQQSSIKRQAAPLLAARRSSAILGGQSKTPTGTLGRHAISFELN